MHTSSICAVSGISKSNSIYSISGVKTGKKALPNLTANKFNTSLRPQTPQTTWRKYSQHLQGTKG